MNFFKKKPVEQVLQLPICNICPNPAQPRTVFDADELSHLAESIRQNGLLQPVTVRRLAENKYELISGERRLRACTLLGMETIKAVLVEVDQQQSAVFALIENLQREDLGFFDEARGLYELIYQWKLTQEETAERLGMAQSTLANKLRLLRLPPALQREICENGLTERHARALLRLQTPEQQLLVLEAITRKRLNVTQTERYIDDLLAQRPAPPKRLLIVKDLRIFLNTIDRAIVTMKQAGIEAVATQNNSDEFIEYTVKIPKQSAYGQRQ